MCKVNVHFVPPLPQDLSCNSKTSHSIQDVHIHYVVLNYGNTTMPPSPPQIDRSCNSKTSHSIQDVFTKQCTYTSCGTKLWKYNHAPPPPLNLTFSILYQSLLTCVLRKVFSSSKSFNFFGFIPFW